MANLPDMFEFQVELSQHKFTVVKFGMVTCGPCKKLKPVMEDLQKLVSSDIHFMDVDIIMQEDIALAEGVNRVPRIHFFVGNDRKPELDVEGYNVEKILASLSRLVSEN